MPTPFFHDIVQQPADLRRLANRYGSAEGEAQLARLPQRSAPLLTGMGASFHAALVAAAHFQHHRLPAQAVEAAELLFYGDGFLATSDAFVFVSQSGESAEVAPVAERLPAAATLLGVTNSPQSTLAHRADLVLPLVAEKEQALVASRTHLNSLAALWLLVRRWAGVSEAGDVADLDAVARVADEVDQLLGAADAVPERWFATLDAAETLLFVGHGPGAATARHAAMMLGEWAKTPALSMSAGAFRHGPIEFARPGLGVVIFSAPGDAHESVTKLVAELDGYGVSTVVVEQGQTFISPAEFAAAAPGNLDPFLAPVLDTVVAQLFCEAFARRRGIDPTFRHIKKVITQI